VGDDLEFLVAGRVLWHGGPVREPMSGGVINIFFMADEIVEAANRLQTDARIEAVAKRLAIEGRLATRTDASFPENILEVNAIGRPRQ
jgi:hypothetical protein